VGKLIAALAVLGVLFVVALNTSFLTSKATEWVEAHPQDVDAPKVMFWVGWWSDLMGDNENAEKLFWQLYQKYPQESPLVAEGLYHIAEIRVNGASRASCLEFCQIIMDKYSSEEKWRMKASQLSEQVKNNVR